MFLKLELLWKCLYIILTAQEFFVRIHNCICKSLAWEFYYYYFFCIYHQGSRHLYCGKNNIVRLFKSTHWISAATYCNNLTQVKHLHCSIVTLDMKLIISIRNDMLCDRNLDMVSYYSEGFWLDLGLKVNPICGSIHRSVDSSQGRFIIGSIHCKINLSQGRLQSLCHLKTWLKRETFCLDIQDW
jgi:hypothetical protein